MWRTSSAVIHLPKGQSTTKFQAGTGIETLGFQSERHAVSLVLILLLAAAILHADEAAKMTAR